MTVYDFDTRAALLESGKAEFLEHGFAKSSLRAICARADVTTGAFYSHFKGKDEFFCAVVEDDLDECGGTYDSLIDRIAGQVVQGDDEERRAIEFIMDHRDLFRLLFDCSEGSPYEGFRDTLIEKLDRAYQSLFDSRAGEQVDSVLVRTIVRMKFTQYSEMIYGGYGNDEVMCVTSQLAEFTKAGIDALLPQYA